MASTSDWPNLTPELPTWTSPSRRAVAPHLPRRDERAIIDEHEKMMPFRSPRPPLLPSWWDTVSVARDGGALGPEEGEGGVQQSEVNRGPTILETLWLWPYSSEKLFQFRSPSSRSNLRPNPLWRRLRMETMIALERAPGLRNAFGITCLEGGTWSGCDPNGYNGEALRQFCSPLF
jgi:hypothetical protein